MKNILIIIISVLCATVCAPPQACAAQQIELDSVHARLSFPDPWLVLTPASLPVYAGILREAGMDPIAMEARFAEDGIVAEGWSEDYKDSYRLLVSEDELSRLLFDIDRASGSGISGPSVKVNPPKIFLKRARSLFVTLRVPTCQSSA